MKSITVYWTNALEGFPSSELSHFSPNYKVRKHLIDRFSNVSEGDDIKNYFRCPSASKTMNNLYGIRSHRDYRVEKIGSAYSTSDVTKEQFDNNIRIRNSASDLIDLKWPLLLFSEDELEIEMLPAFFENTEFSRETTLLPGGFDISKWFRSIEPSILHHKKVLNIKRGDIIYYIKFKTDRRIEFKHFEYTRELEKYHHSVTDFKYFKKNLPMKALYNIFREKKYNKRILKHIKSNLTGY